MGYISGDPSSGDLDELLAVRVPMVTPERYGAIGNFSGNAGTAANDNMPLINAINAASASGSKLVFRRTYYSADDIILSNMDISWEFIDDAAVVFAPGKGIIISQADYSYFTNIRRASLLTLGVDAATILSVSYTATDSLNNRHLPRCSLDEITVRGWDIFSHGPQVGVYTKDVHVNQINRLSVTGRRNTGAAGRTSFCNMTAGLKMDSTSGLASIPSDNLLSAVAVANAETAIMLTGEHEGLKVANTNLVGVGSGIVVVNDSARPSLQAYANHINCFDDAISLTRCPQAQILPGNNLYKMPGASRTWRGVYLNLCDNSQVGTQAYYNTATDFNNEGHLVAIHMHDTVGGLVARQGISRGTIGIRLTGACDKNRVAAPVMLGSYPNAPAVIAIDNQSTGLLNEFDGVVADGANTGAITVAAALTNLKTVSLPVVQAGDRFRVIASAELVKGATPGNIAMVAYKTAGTAGIVFEKTLTQAKDNFPSLPASTSKVLRIVSDFTVTAGGTLDVSIQANSAGSDASVTANGAQIVIHRI